MNKQKNKRKKIVFDLKTCKKNQQVGEMMFLIKTNFFHEFSWFWDFQNKKQKQTPSRENQKKLGEKKEKHLLKQKILFQVEKLFFGFTSFFFGFFVSSGGCLVFWFWKSKKARKLMEKVRIISLMFFGFSKCASMTNQKNGKKMFLISRHVKPQEKNST